MKTLVMALLLGWMKTLVMALLLERLEENPCDGLAVREAGQKPLRWIGC